jgi:hypothetical protein
MQIDQRQKSHRKTEKEEKEKKERDTGRYGAVHDYLSSSGLWQTEQSAPGTTSE